YSYPDYIKVGCVLLTLNLRVKPQSIQGLNTYSSRKVDCFMNNEV
ncbi:hypothetical protein AVEN_248511-2-1, partial [Araneus ventricosus]